MLAREFTVSAPDTGGTTDITCVRTHQGWQYLAIVMDLYLRQIVGWAMARHMKTSLCTDALMMTVSHSGKGQCRDNAPTERFFRSLKLDRWRMKRCGRETMRGWQCRTIWLITTVNDRTIPWAICPPWNMNR